MSETYLPEICDSLFPHHPMRFVDKCYYKSLNDKILCGECIPPWIDLQSFMLAKALIRPILTIMKYALNGIIIPGNRICIDGEVPVLDYMKPVFSYDIITFYIESEKKADPEDPLGKMEIKLTICLDNYQNDMPLYPFAQLQDAEHGELLDENEPFIFEYLKNTCANILTIWIESHFIFMCDHEVQAFIEAKENGYSSTASDEPHCECDCPHGTSEETIGECVNCGAGLESPYYIYQNAAYCLDCMYAIVVDASVRSNLSDIVGLAQAEEMIPSTNRKYGSTDEFKMSVIDKYFNYMKGFTNLIYAHRM